MVYTTIQHFIPLVQLIFRTGHEDFKELNLAPCIERSQLVLQSLLCLCEIISLPPQHILIVVQQLVPRSIHLCKDIFSFPVLTSVVCLIKLGIGAPAAWT